MTEIEIVDDTVCRVIDPVIEIAKTLPGPFAPIAYQHDGSPSFLLGVIDPVGQGHLARANRAQPPRGAATPRPPNLSPQLEAMVRALRDAELLVLGSIPAAMVRDRYAVFS